MTAAAEPRGHRVHRLVEPPVVGMVQRQRELARLVRREAGQRDADEGDPALADQGRGGVQEPGAAAAMSSEESVPVTNERDRVAFV